MPIARVPISGENSKGETISFWQVSPGREERGFWPEFKTASIIAMGWDDLGNLNNYSTEGDIENALRKHYPADYPKNKSPSNDVSSIKFFSQLIKKGHVIVAKKGSSREVYGIGKVLHKYHFVGARESFKHVIDVDWIIGFDEKVEVDTKREFVQWTAHPLKPARFEEIRNSILRKYPQLRGKFDLLMESPSREMEPKVKVRPLNLQPSLIKTKLMIAENVLRQICANLKSGSHIIITGPVGTGKTSLTEDICCAAKENALCDGYVLTTGSSDWTTFDTIGGYMPTEEGKLKFEEGKFLEAIRDNKWLIIDEINRADIDKAFGQLFTVLSGQRVELPFRYSDGKTLSIEPIDEVGSYFDNEAATYKVGRNWRILATMNIYDMNFLFEMSYAFMRRFAFVYLDIPENFEQLIDQWCSEKKIPDKTKEKLKKLTKLAERKMGPAIIKDIVEYIECREDGERELAEAIVAYVLPQLEGLEKDRIEKTWFEIGKIFEEREVPNRIIWPILREIVGIELNEIPE